MWIFISIWTQVFISSIVLMQELSSECFDKSKKVDIEKCCAFPRPIPEDELPACIAKYQYLEKDHRNYIVCLTDCQSTGLGFLKKNRIDLKVFRKIIQNMEPVAQDAMDRVAQLCIRVINEQKAGIAKTGTKCSSMAFAFFKCLGQQVFTNCPDKYWSTNEICTKYDKGVAFCDNN